MAADDSQGNGGGNGGKATEAPRFVYGSRPLGALVPMVTRAAFKRRPPAAAQVLADWDSIVGPALAQMTMPRRVSAGTLVIACDGPVAMELQHLQDVLLSRINTALGTTGGKAAVQRLRFVQESLPRPAPPRAPPPQRAVAAAERAVGDFPEGPLREALSRLGQAVLTPR